MNIIDIDATNWKTVSDFYENILSGLGAPAWHGHNVNALIDSIVWGQINEIKPPYMIRIRGTAKHSKNLLNEIELVKQGIEKACIEYRAKRGHDMHVSLEIVPSGMV